MSVILMYHGVGDTPAPHSEPRYTLSQARFAAQLHGLQRSGAEVVPLEACLVGGGGRRGVALTFDDGEASVARAALPLMAAQGMVGTAYVTAGWVGQPGYLSRDELCALADAGWSVGAHGVTHRYLSHLDDAELARELSRSRQLLEEYLGQPVTHMSLPGGRADPRVKAAARHAGFRSLATSRPGRVVAGTSPMDLPRVAVLSGLSLQNFNKIAEGHLGAYLKIMGRAMALDSVKGLLGDRRYDRLRAGVLRLIGK